MNKIKMKTPLVEMDGDEMTRILWKIVKEELLLPFVELKTIYFDLGLKHRDETDDGVTLEAAEAAKQYGVAVKCATITPNRQRMEEYSLKEMWKSPNGTIRAVLDGTVFRTPIASPRIRPAVRSWEQPITIARHAYGDVYRAAEATAAAGDAAELAVTDKDGKETRTPVFKFAGEGILQAQYNTLSSVRSFARSCFEYALSVKRDLWFSTKDTISKTYDQTFKLVFERLYEAEYRARFEEAGITYFYTLVDDAVARVVRSKGGFVWALKNYDGDVMSDMISSAFGSLAMMTSVLVSPDGKFEYEAAHGTVTRHYYRYLQGERTSTNPMATIFAWSGALRKRGELDGTGALVRFADALEGACLDTIQSGIVTKDLVPLAEGNVTAAYSDEFIGEIAKRLKQALHD